MVELDITGKALGDDGFAEVATALVTSIEYTSEHGRLVKLEELCLRDNNLDVSSLPALGQVVRMAAQDLRDLDISNNLIEIRTDEEAQIFLNFLRCFADCCVLRRIDLSGNALGPKAFEILMRVYGQEDPIDVIALESPDGGLEHDGGTGRSNIHDPTASEKRLRGLSVTSDPGEHPSEISRSSPGQAPSAQEKSRKGWFAVALVQPMLTWSTLQNAKHQSRQASKFYKAGVQGLITLPAVCAQSRTLCFRKQE